MQKPLIVAMNKLSRRFILIFKQFEKKKTKIKMTDPQNTEHHYLE